MFGIRRANEVIQTKVQKRLYMKLTIIHIYLGAKFLYVHIDKNIEFINI